MTQAVAVAQVAQVAQAELAASDVSLLSAWPTVTVELVLQAAQVEITWVYLVALKVALIVLRLLVH